MNRATGARLTAGALSGLLGQVVTLGGQLLMIPLFLRAWGAERYGEWLTLWAAIAYIGLVDLGMSMYVINRLTSCYSTGEREEYRRTFKTSLSLYVAVAGMVTVAAVVLVSLVPIDRVFMLRALDRGTASTAVLLLALLVSWSVPQGLIIGLYRTFGQFARGQMVAVAQQALALAFTAVALALGAGVAEVAGVQLAPLLAVTTFLVLDLRRRRPLVDFAPGPVQWRLALSFIAPSLMFVAIQGSLAMTIQGSVLIVNALLGGAAVAAFVVQRTVVNMLRQGVGLLNHPAWPELISIRAQGDDARLRLAHRLLAKAGLASTASIAIVLHFVGADLIGLWTANRVLVDQAVLDSLLLLSISQAVWLGSSSFPLAFNEHRRVAFCYVLSSLLGLALAWLLIRSVGLVGIGLGLLVADLAVCTWFIPWDVCRSLGDSTARFWYEVVVRGVPVAAGQWVAVAVIAWVVNDPLLRATLAMALVVGILACLGPTLWLGTGERKEVARMLRQAWRALLPAGRPAVQSGRVA